MSCWGNQNMWLLQVKTLVLCMLHRCPNEFVATCIGSLKNTPDIVGKLKGVTRKTLHSAKQRHSKFGKTSKIEIMAPVAACDDNWRR